jgi:membrane protease YdiL (CAAX protease family)
MQAKRPWIEIQVVFSLSLGASAVYSFFSLLAKLTASDGLANQTATIHRQLAEREWLDLSYQLLGFTFGLAPVALVLFLLWEKNKSPFTSLGFDFRDPVRDLARGGALAIAIGVPGLGLYIASRLTGISAEVIPADLGKYWWTVPVLLLAAVNAALVEELIVVGYLFKRLTQLKVSAKVQILVSALIRGAYHLYQGFGGFIGNFLMGLVFGWLYQRWGRVMPLVVAHFLLDATIFVGYSALNGVLPIP